MASDASGDNAAKAEQAAATKDKGKQPAAEAVAEDESGESEEEGPAAGAGGDGDNVTGSAASKKKKKKKSKKKKAAGGASATDADLANLKRGLDKMTDAELQELVKMNPALEGELRDGGARNEADMAARLRRMNIQEIMAGLSSSGRNVKDMGAYKFWKTQPVPKFGEAADEKLGPMQEVKKADELPQDPDPLPDGFEWVTMDLTDDKELEEVHDLLEGHYVEDDTAMLRFNYSLPILRWALMAPGWKPNYHCGVRASQSRKLVAFVSAIPVSMRVRTKTFTVSEVNFLVVHKKLRGKRLAPVMIKEITRRSNLDGIWQGLYTAGVVLPTPISTCRYYHRALDWKKLYDIGFSPLPPGSTEKHMIRRFQLPDKGSLKGWRPMVQDDIDQVLPLLTRYLKKFEFTPNFTRDEFEHWFVSKTEDREERVVWAWVVEDENKKITDFISVYGLDSSVINHVKYKLLRAVYLFYYATETGLKEPTNKGELKKRLNELMREALIAGKKLDFDVFNATTIMENSLMLGEHHFGAGDGNLHYYLFNYRAGHIFGGVGKDNKLDEKNLSGIALVML